MLKTQILMNNGLYSTVHLYRELYTLFDNVRDTYIRSVWQLHGVVWMYNKRPRITFHQNNIRHAVLKYMCDDIKSVYNIHTS